MSKCKYCGQNILGFTDRKETELKHNKIIVATDWQLRRISHVHRLAIATLSVKQEKHLSRRGLPDWLADVIYGYLYDQDGRILWPAGRTFEIEEETIDNAFASDGSFRWLSDFLGFAHELPKQRPQSRVLMRLRLIDLAFRIEYPKRAELIAR